MDMKLVSLKKHGIELNSIETARAHAFNYRSSHSKKLLLRSQVCPLTK